MKKIFINADMNGGNVRKRVNNDNRTLYKTRNERYLVTWEEIWNMVRSWGQSVSSLGDRDSMNYIIRRFNIGGRFKYRPSVDEFSYID